MPPMPEPSPEPGSFDETVTRLRQVAAERKLAPDEILHLVFGTQAPVASELAAGGAAAETHRVLRDVGRYLIIAELGRGGMGVVYRARDKSLGRDVAIKVLSTMGVPAEMLDRFQREARAAAALDHPHIVKVLDVGELPSDDQRGRGSPFYAMELLHGEDLAHAIGTNQLSPRIAVEVVRQIASALGYAHQKGVLHRDVKPANIWLLRNPGPAPVSPVTETTWHVHALLLDFGLAKLLDKGVAQGSQAEGLGGWLTLTESGQLLGTPVYMSPEQVRGAHDVDGHADIYSLGATLYHALTGRPPFTGSTLTYLLDAVRRDDPVPPRKLNPSIPKDLDTLCLACLAKDPARRYKTAEDLAEDCRRFLAGEPLRAKPPGPAERGVRWAKRRPVRAAILALAILLGSGAAYRYLGPARLKVMTVPEGARVTVNDEPIGDGRWIWPIGSLRVRIEADGWEPQEHWVELLPGFDVDMGTVVLVPDHGFATIESDPPGADVLIDGVPTGRKTPVASLRLKNGLHRLDLMWTDRPPRVDVIEIKPGQTTTVADTR